jgi:hypothetical protein
MRPLILPHLHLLRYHCQVLSDDESEDKEQAASQEYDPTNPHPDFRNPTKTDATSPPPEPHTSIKTSQKAVTDSTLLAGARAYAPALKQQHPIDRFAVPGVKLLM